MKATTAKELNVVLVVERVIAYDNTVRYTSWQAFHSRRYDRQASNGGGS